MINSYIEKRRIRLERFRERENFIFGITMGFILLLLNIYIFLSRYDNSSKDQFNVFFMVIGTILILLAVIYPNILDPLHKLFKAIFNVIGKILISILLTIIYFLLVYPIGLIMQKKNKSIDENTNFTNYDGNVEFTSKNSFMIFKIFGVFKIFTDERYMLMLPLIIVLLLFSILFIFVQSSVITPFIYTLF